MATISSDPALAAAFAAARADGRPALIPYLTAGFPDYQTSLAALRVADARADIIEVGVPFSDPLADGPTIQRSTFAALEQGMTLPRTLELIREAELTRPVVLFSYLNPIRRYGLERLLHAAPALGIRGLLLTDLPAGGDPAFESAVAASPIDLIRLLAPTTSDARIAEAVRDASGFLYLVARLGVTGASRELAHGLDEYVARVRRHTALPLAVGFGISTPAQAVAVARMADGVVVGSALVDVLANDGVDGAARFLDGLQAALRTGSSSSA